MYERDSSPPMTLGWQLIKTGFFSDVRRWQVWWRIWINMLFSPAELAVHWSVPFSNVRSNSGQSYIVWMTRENLSNGHLTETIETIQRRMYVLTRVESTAFTSRSWMMLHCDRLTNDDKPWNCFTLVILTCAGFLLVTEIKEKND